MKLEVSVSLCEHVMCLIILIDDVSLTLTCDVSFPNTLP